MFFHFLENIKGLKSWRNEAIFTLLLLSSSFTRLDYRGNVINIGIDFLLNALQKRSDFSKIAMFYFHIILSLTNNLPDKPWKPMYDLLRPVRMRVTWAVSLPRLFSATHSYLPASFISMLCMNRSPRGNTVARGSVSAAIPKVLYHVI